MRSSAVYRFWVIVGALALGGPASGATLDLNVAADAGKPLEVYDLTTDPQETTSVAAKHPDVVKKIETIMATAHTNIEIPKPDPRVWKKYEEDNRKRDELFR
ncbi:MAG: hypothetical protein ABSG53_32790 [Thermoguttaceae bacterium]|jgi:hypothetical protein